MAKLNGSQISQLRALSESDTPLWGGCPPNTQRVDPDLSKFIAEGFVIWTGRGYVLTDAGRSALSGDANAEREV
ncbi:hypothetical protein GGQ64_005366 [Rhizobium azooxidifex]|uniref:Uncharacterized protein n=1 Tax=Mycoplana azooxidifex TaxID=1636188 RepID=A0A7W6GNM1_9HYPH|nr:hypothetical protein [Mycoplana azooxidifex]